MADSISSLTSKGLTDAISKGVSDGISSASKNKTPDLSANAGYQSHEDLLSWHNKMHGLDDESKNRKALEKLSEEQKNFSQLFERFAQKYDTIQDGVSKRIANIESGKESAWSRSMDESDRDEKINFGKSAELGIIRSLSSLVGRTGGVSMQRTVEDQVTQNPIEKDKDTSVTRRVARVADAGDRRQSIEKDNLRYEEQKMYQDKVLKSLDAFKEFVYSGTEGEGIKIKGDGGEGGDGGLLSNIFGGMAGLLAGLVTGVVFAKVRNAAKLWGSAFKTVASGVGKNIKKALSWMKDTKLGKTVSELGNKIKGVINSFKSGVGEIKSLFTKTLNSWKNTVKNSVLGKAVSGAKKAVSKVGGLLSKLGSKVADGAKVVGKATAKLGKAVVKNAPSILKTAGKVGMNVAKGVSKVVTAPVEMAARMGEAVKNSYDVYKKGGSITDTMTTFGGGMIDSVTDTLMLPELVNSAKGAYKGLKKGGLSGALKGAGEGFMAERDPDRISWGQQYMAKIQNFAGNGNETTRRLAKGGTFTEQGLRRVNSNAAGFGNSAGFYDPEYEKQLNAKRAAGSLENSKAPTAELTDKKLTGEVTSEADLNKTLIEGIKAGVKDAYLSPEVQAAQMNQAKETGKELRTTLVG